MAIGAFSRRRIQYSFSFARSVQIQWVVLVLLAISSSAAISCISAAEPSTHEPSASDQAKLAYETVSLRGKVVWLGESLKRRYGIELDADAVQSACALETADELLLLAKDSRGRGFWLDERLRDSDVELLVRRYPGSPVLKVIRVFAIKPDGRYEVDYWCNVCSIPMYELKACECCQGPTELRLRRVDDDDL